MFHWKTREANNLIIGIRQLRAFTGFISHKLFQAGAFGINFADQEYLSDHDH